VLAQPPNNPGFGRRFRRLAQDVGIDQVNHKLSVDSDSIGTK
jgi:hypothetical protein